MKVRPLYPDEVKLIEQSRSNNRRAQKQLYDKYAPKMLSVCRYYVKDIHHAEDLLMQGFFKAFTHLHQFGRTDNFEGWLRKIMVREALSFLRKKIASSSAMKIIFSKISQLLLLLNSLLNTFRI